MFSLQSKRGRILKSFFTWNFGCSSLLAVIKRNFETFLRHLRQTSVWVIAEASVNLLGITTLSIVRKIPLSNDTMARRVDKIAEDLEDQLAAKKLLWCIATDTLETCSNNVIVPKLGQQLLQRNTLKIIFVSKAIKELVSFHSSHLCEQGF